MSNYSIAILAMSSKSVHRICDGLRESRPPSNPEGRARLKAGFRPSRQTNPGLHPASRSEPQWLSCSWFFLSMTDSELRTHMVVPETPRAALWRPSVAFDALALHAVLASFRARSSALKWVYLLSMARVRCPLIAATSMTLKPCPNSRVTALCRTSCSRTPTR